MVGKLFGDKGYIDKQLFGSLFKRALQFITGIRKNIRKISFYLLWISYSCVNAINKIRVIEIMISVLQQAQLKVAKLITFIYYSSILQLSSS